MSSLFALRCRTLPRVTSFLCRPHIAGAGCFEFARFLSNLKNKNSHHLSVRQIRHFSSRPQAPDLQKLLEKVKQNTAKRCHDGLKISYDDSIKASTEERHFKEIKEVCDSLRKIIEWRMELAQSICYEADEIEKQIKIKVSIEKKAVPRSYFSLNSSLDTHFRELIKNQEPVAQLLQKSVALLDQIKTNYALLYKRALKLPHNPVKTALSLQAPQLPVSHQWEKKELSKELQEEIQRYVVHELQPLHRNCVRSLHLAELKLEMLEKALTHKKLNK